MITPIKTTASVEEIVKAVFSATPKQRARIAAVLNGTDTDNAKSEKRDSRLVTISGAAKLLSVGRSTVYKLIAQRRLTTVELTGVPRVTMQSLNEFLDGQHPANEATAAMIEESKTRYAKSKSRKVA